MADEDWGEDDSLKAPKYVATAIVTQDYIPETLDHLTLILDDTVYVFSKQTGVPGFWEGETKGVFGLFPANHVRILEEHSS